MIKSFKAQMDDGTQQTIRLSTNDGLTGYKIHKFRCMATKIGTASTEGIFRIWTREQTTLATAAVDIDFNDSELLGVGICRSSTDLGATGSDDHIIFDNVTFNQDIYITYTDNQDATSSNYYLELEQVKLDLSEATVATLKDMRGA